MKIIKEFDRADEERRRIIYADYFDPAEFDSVIAMYQKIVNDYPDSRAAKDSLKRISQLKKQKEKRLKEWDTQKEFTFTGTLEVGTTDVTEKATHKIIGQTGEIVAFVYSDNVDLRAYEERIVTIEGMKYTSAKNMSGKIIPVLKIMKISLD